MYVWVKNIKTGEIVEAARLPKGYGARNYFDGFIIRKEIKDKENYKLLYKNPFINREE